MRGKGEGSIWKRSKGVFVARLTVSYNEQGNPKQHGQLVVSHAT